MDTDTWTAGVSGAVVTGAAALGSAAEPSCCREGLMEEALVPWAGRESIQPDEEAALLSRVPLLAGDSKKMDYLCWRATGFPVRQACDLVGVKQSTVNRWRNSDAVFRVFESDRLPELQRMVGRDVLRLDFMRNFRLLLRKDAEVIWKAYHESDEMSDRDWQYFRQIRSHYTANDFLNLEKALEPEKHREKPVKIQLTFGGAPQSLNSDELLEADFRELTSDD